MAEKNFKLKTDQIKTLAPGWGACMATDMITVDGYKVGFMYRDEPYEDVDSGWRFFSGIEDQEYVDDPNNTMIYNINTIANYDPAIIPYLGLPLGTELERGEGTDKFNIVSG